MPLAKKGKKTEHSRFAISGAGVLHVRASEVLKTQNAKDQLSALKRVKIADVRRRDPHGVISRSKSN